MNPFTPERENVLNLAFEPQKDLCVQHYQVKSAGVFNQAQLPMWTV